jgi:hypothetical protein
VVNQNCLVRKISSASGCRAAAKSLSGLQLAIQPTTCRHTLKLGVVVAQARVALRASVQGRFAPASSRR